MKVKAGKLKHRDLTQKRPHGIELSIKKILTGSLVGVSILSGTSCITCCRTNGTIPVEVIEKEDNSLGDRGGKNHKNPDKKPGRLPYEDIIIEPEGFTDPEQNKNRY